jgi:hypothetical protein
LTVHSSQGCGWGLHGSISFGTPFDIINIATEESVHQKVAGERLGCLGLGSLVDADRNADTLGEELPKYQCEHIIMCAEYHMLYPAPLQVRQGLIHQR